MLAKCANPSCSSEFHSLFDGRLFILPSTANGAGYSSRVNFCGLIQNAQYAWLCNSCCRDLTVVLDSENKIKVTSQRWIGEFACLLVPVLWATSAISEFALL